MVEKDFIQGQKFFKVADFIYALNHRHPDDYYNLAKTVVWNKLKEHNVIYAHTFHVKMLFDIIQHLEQSFTIITHNCDCKVEEQGVMTPLGNSEIGKMDFCTIPDNVIKWYSTNVNLVHPRIESIPIGVENNNWQGKNPSKMEQILAKKKEPRNYKNLLYMNHNIATNVKQRAESYELFEKKPWVTSYRGHNGINFGVYIDNIYNHKFTISPQGNGMDTHRTWECLYVKSIPIEKRNLNNRFYADLPICFVDEWEEITEDFLNAEYRRITNKKWNMNKINFEYWKNKILK